jgi:F0F1-type ATP synthase membrane subunit c/vacuolar-type H+-ATPase subunit K
MDTFGDLGLSYMIVCTASVYGASLVCLAAIGVYAAKHAENKKASAMLIVLMAMPTTHVIYAMLFVSTLAKVTDPNLFVGKMILALCIGIAMGSAAIGQGKIGIRACAALKESDKDATNYILAMGLIETASLLAMIVGKNLIPIAK